MLRQPLCRQPRGQDALLWDASPVHRPGYYGVRRWLGRGHGQHVRRRGVRSIGQSTLLRVASADGVADSRSHGQAHGQAHGHAHRQAHRRAHRRAQLGPDSGAHAHPDNTAHAEPYGCANCDAHAHPCQRGDRHAHEPHERA